MLEALKQDVQGDIYTKSYRSVRSVHVSRDSSSINQSTCVGPRVSPQLLLLSEAAENQRSLHSNREGSMGEMSLDWGFSSAGGAAMDEEDEVLASNEGSEEVTHVLSVL